MERIIDVQKNHSEYEAIEGSQLAKTVDEMFRAATDVQKMQAERWPGMIPTFKGDDRAEELVAAIMHYLRRCDE